MTTEIALLLAQDGLVNGAIYALLALALILVFTVTRVVFVPQGEFVTYGALTMAALQQGAVPGVVTFLVITGWMAAAIELWTGIRTPHRRRAMTTAALFALYPSCLAAILFWVTGAPDAVWMQVVVTLAIVVPFGAILYRIVFQPMANASVLVLMIAAVALHLLLMGVGLLAFGPEGARTQPLIDATFTFGTMMITGQSLTAIAASIVLIAVLFWGFTFTLRGKALRATAVNSVGARLVGIRPEVAGTLCFTLAALVGAISGILISSITTIYYDTGLLIALKGFIGAIIGALVSYPVGALGAILVGLIEAFSSFWASAFKEALLFGLILPILLVLSVTHPSRGEAE
ncbi:branched-chain amino acid transport system permease protein [Rhodoligotrophos appendicifer]|uniref:branched-chain amino acid ABC transporter permease n=1 Tax=Rhodoligotrophos appendicifer TaxID=987056 RepID=UPI001184EDB6|nr:branched-chain amino acid ABC transporter permease [Rhodoligotrophos appendicifer]